MLSCLDDREIKNILRRQTLKPHTENTVKNINELLADLGSVRKRGYAVDNEEIEIGLRCVGAPLRDYTGGMVGAISVAAPSARLSEKNTPVIGRMVIAIAAGISEKLGFDKPKTAQAQ
jgi:DNA-binding IclR family transcriptional regulator